MNERRKEKLLHAAKTSQLNVTVILENVTDSHNIGAILRTCDSVGIRHVYVVNTSGKKEADLLTLGKRTTMGSRKWVDVHYFKDLDNCIAEVRKKHDVIYGAALNIEAMAYTAMDYTSNIALLFGNEHTGLSPEAVSQCDHLIFIPQVGLAQSLNVSVAAAIVLYELHRQRDLIGKYTDHPDIDTHQAKELMEYFVEKIRSREKNSKRYKIKPL